MVYVVITNRFYTFCRLSPNVLWAQTKDAVYMTVEIQQDKDVSVQLKDDSVTIAAQEYQCTVNFYKPIKSSEAMKSTDRFLRLKFPKKEEERWPSLNADGKKHWIKIDWDKWVDSDAEDDERGMDDFDMSAFENMGNFGQFGGMDMNDDPFDYEDLNCCGKGDCPCDKCKCGGSLCDCGKACECQDCQCNEACNCGVDCGSREPRDYGTICCESCTCGDDCRCTPDNKCGPNCNCPGTEISSDHCKCEDSCSCGGNCKCTDETKCVPACKCAVAAC
ncbi:hypothetical protein X943_002840 [Babesia divergens]|uniref:CS domain-containing protein n=1 Tax=Babesia divergens TaxID=32595 RepID=A0AAD9G7G9_BABDI|nr:hypothetical protein X943_002840 [Babesia divergens]